MPYEERSRSPTSLTQGRPSIICTAQSPPKFVSPAHLSPRRAAAWYRSACRCVACDPTLDGVRPLPNTLYTRKEHRESTAELNRLLKPAPKKGEGESSEEDDFDFASSSARASKAPSGTFLPEPAGPVPGGLPYRRASVVDSTGAGGGLATPQQQIQHNLPKLNFSNTANSSTTSAPIHSSNPRPFVGGDSEAASPMASSGGGMMGESVGVEQFATPLSFSVHVIGGHGLVATSIGGLPTHGSPYVRALVPPENFRAPEEVLRTPTMRNDSSPQWTKSDGAVQHIKLLASQGFVEFEVWHERYGTHRQLDDVLGYAKVPIDMLRSRDASVIGRHTYPVRSIVQHVPKSNNSNEGSNSPDRTKEGSLTIDIAVEDWTEAAEEYHTAKELALANSPTGNSILLVEGLRLSRAGSPESPFNLSPRASPNQSGTGNPAGETVEVSEEASFLSSSQRGGQATTAGSPNGTSARRPTTVVFKGEELERGEETPTQTNPGGLEPGGSIAFSPLHRDETHSFQSAPAFGEYSHEQQGLDGLCSPCAKRPSMAGSTGGRTPRGSIQKIPLRRKESLGAGSTGGGSVRRASYNSLGPNSSMALASSTSASRAEEELKRERRAAAAAAVANKVNVWVAGGAGFQSLTASASEGSNPYVKVIGPPRGNGIAGCPLLLRTPTVRGNENPNWEKCMKSSVNVNLADCTEAEGESRGYVTFEVWHAECTGDQLLGSTRIAAERLLRMAGGGRMRGGGGFHSTLPVERRRAQNVRARASEPGTLGMLEIVVGPYESQIRVPTCTSPSHRQSMARLYAAGGDDLSSKSHSGSSTALSAKSGDAHPIDPSMTGASMTSLSLEPSEAFAPFGASTSATGGDGDTTNNQSSPVIRSAEEISRSLMQASEEFDLASAPVVQDEQEEEEAREEARGKVESTESVDRSVLLQSEEYATADFEEKIRALVAAEVEKKKKKEEKEVAVLSEFALKRANSTSPGVKDGDDTRKERGTFGPAAGSEPPAKKKSGGCCG